MFKYRCDRWKPEGDERRFLRCVCVCTRVCFDGFIIRRCLMSVILLDFIWLFSRELHWFLALAKQKIMKRLYFPMSGICVGLCEGWRKGKRGRDGDGIKTACHSRFDFFPLSCQRKLVLQLFQAEHCYESLVMVSTQHTHTTSRTHTWSRSIKNLQFLRTHLFSLQSLCLSLGLSLYLPPSILTQLVSVAIHSLADFQLISLTQFLSSCACARVCVCVHFVWPKGMEFSVFAVGLKGFSFPPHTQCSNWPRDSMQ